MLNQQKIYNRINLTQTVSTLTFVNLVCEWQWISFVHHKVKGTIFQSTMECQWTIHKYHKEFRTRLTTPRTNFHLLTTAMLAHIFSHNSQATLPWCGNQTWLWNPAYRHSSTQRTAQAQILASLSSKNKITITKNAAPRWYLTNCEWTSLQNKTNQRPTEIPAWILTGTMTLYLCSKTTKRAGNRVLTV